MRYTGKSELLLKYQKTKAKLIEYDVPNDAYPNFPVNSNDLSFSTVYILSRYAESIIENDANIKLSLGLILKKLLSIMMQLLSQKNDCSMIRTF